MNALEKGYLSIFKNFLLVMIILAKNKAVKSVGVWHPF